jgi:catechol-2,3-dioxygenase
MTVRLSKFVHVVYRTRRFDEMLAWYKTVFGADVQYQDPAIAFLTYDDEHHRFAFVNMDQIDPGAADPMRSRCTTATPMATRWSSRSTAYR